MRATLLLPWMLCAPAFGAATVPGGCYLADGLEVGFVFKFLYENFEEYVPTVLFGGVASPEAWFVPKIFHDDDDGSEIDRYSELRCIVPPSEVPGTVDVRVIFTPLSPEVPAKSPRNFPQGFTYVGAPLVASIAPDSYSIVPEAVPVVFWGLGFTVRAAMRVYFGDAAATAVAVSEGGRKLTCMPPDFPGGEWPLAVDIRVENPEEHVTTLPGGFTYEILTPVISRTSTSLTAWTARQSLFVYMDRVVDGPVQVYVDGVLGENSAVYTVVGRSIVTIAPALPPGLYDVTIVNGDGGIATKTAAQLYTGTASTDFHAGDTDKDFRFSLPEVLRVIQLYNSPGIHCDAASEDGYALGRDGDRTCTPYPTDNDPQDWQIGLSEVMAIIEFYNMHCYQPCPDAPGTYCPPSSRFDQ